MDPVARARAIAARLSGSSNEPTEQSEQPAPKRSRWGAEPAPAASAVANAMNPGGSSNAMSAVAMAMGQASQPGSALGGAGGGSSNAMAALAAAMAVGGGSGAGGSSSAPRASSTSSAVLAALSVASKAPKDSKKVFIPSGPEFGDIDFKKLIIGPRGMTQKDMEQRFGCKILIRGRGSQRDGSSGMDGEDEELHAFIEGSAESVTQAAAELERIMSSPEEAQALKAKQLASLAEMNGGGSGGGMGQLALMGGSGSHYGPGSSSGGGQPQMLGASATYGHQGGSDEVHETINVPNSLVGSLIGRGGETIQSIQRNSGCHVQIARNEDQPPSAMERPVSLRGNPDAVQRAKQEINRVLSEKQQQNNQQQSSQQYGPGGGGGSSSSGASLSIKVPNTQVGLIIGKQGTTIKSIQERTGANLNIPPAADVDDPMNRTITITAPSMQQVEQAAEEVNRIVADRLAQMGQGLGGAGGGGLMGRGGGGPQTTLHNMTIKNEFSGAVIGKGGTTIRSIQERTGCRVQIPSNADPGTNPPARTITISGTPDGIQRAIREVTDAILMHGGHGGQPLPPGVSIEPGPSMGAYGAGGGYGGVGGYGGGYGQGNPMIMMGAGVGGCGYGQPLPGAGMMGGAPPMMDMYAQQQAMYAQQQQQPWPQQQQPGQEQQPPPPPADGGATSEGQAPPATADGGDGSAAAAAAATVASDPAAAAAATPDPTAYYEEFWQYYAAYGEDLARQYYGAWSPPLGTAPPPGVVAPPPPPPPSDATNGAEGAAAAPPADA